MGKLPGKEERERELNPCSHINEAGDRLIKGANI